MQEKQDSIIQHNFTHRLPKAIIDKISEPNDSKETGRDIEKTKGKGREGKFEQKIK
jgi:hypothetical protein